LQGFPVDSLKIDRAFTSKMCVDSESREIVRIIIMLAHNLGLSVIAEGVETAEQVSQLQELDCDLAQGFFFSRPADWNSTQEFLQNRHLREAGVASGFRS
jgi:EAL domain-containing protein (putative c-di-GMP-specific phosphodiesterase class I)